ncbi:putative cytochrome P450 [Lojkania enalia]|uniref:Cytochrome P450 n=1 Tax=Lojkania enalia TaxID=147567 RepID=A0A9P4N9P9_9PLEO|nr:putative cytochrome P450 [Didymosphaeria enalia]
MTLLENINLLCTLGLLSTGIVLYAVFLVIYRLFFHPLSDVPGPWYAAISTFYEFWWDCLESGRYWTKIREMHQKYGPIIRINPREVHINDVAFTNNLWSNSKLDKDPLFYRGFGINKAAFTSVSADVHSMRRRPMAYFFSKANVAKLEPRILKWVQHLCDRIEQLKAEHRPIDVSNAYRCFATDVVTDYAFPNTREFLLDPDFRAGFNNMIRDTSAFINWNRHFPFVYPLVRLVPRDWIAYFNKYGGLTAVVDNQLEVKAQARAVLNSEKSKDIPVILNEIFESDALPPSEKTFDRIFSEAYVVIQAGTETTGSTLAVLTYYLISNPSTYEELKVELNKAAKAAGSAPGSLLTCQMVEPLPFLQATIKEALRIGTSVFGRLPRRNPIAAITYTAPSGKTYVLPPGTSVSMSLTDLHWNKDIFPNPLEFNPSRWLEATPEKLRVMEKAFMPFGRGVRQCIGLELAKQELLLVAANLFWKFDFELWNTTIEDVTPYHDFFASWPANNKGVWVKAKN